MINKDGKLFGKISIIDILVVLLIAVLALGIYSRFFVGNEKVETASSHIEYILKVPEVREGTVDALKTFKGPMYDTTTKEYLGEIIRVTSTEAISSVEMANGSIKESTVPERFDALITVRVDGKINNSGYYTATNQVIAAGGSLTFQSKAAATSGTIMDVYEAK